MMRNVVATILFGLVLVLAAACPNADSNGGGSSDRSSDIVDPAVWEALEEQAKVKVYVGLRKLDIPLAEQTFEMRTAHAASVQTSVLAVLSAEDFELTRQYSRIASFVGYMSKAAVTQAAAHPDVRGTSLIAIGIRN